MYSLPIPIYIITSLHHYENFFFNQERTRTVAILNLGKITSTIVQVGTIMQIRTHSDTQYCSQVFRIRIHYNADQIQVCIKLPLDPNTHQGSKKKNQISFQDF